MRLDQHLQIVDAFRLAQEKFKGLKFGECIDQIERLLALGVLPLNKRVFALSKKYQCMCGLSLPLKELQRFLESVLPLARELAPTNPYFLEYIQHQLESLRSGTRNQNQTTTYTSDQENLPTDPERSEKFKPPPELSQKAKVL